MSDPKKPALYQLIVVYGDGHLAFPQAQAVLDSLKIFKSNDAFKKITYPIE